MTKLSKIVIVASLFIVILSHQLMAQGKVSFFKGKLEEMQQTAVTQNKPYLLYFYTGWCSPCREMENHAFSDPELVKHLDNEMLAYAINADENDRGLGVAAKYQVMMFPTTVICEPNGDIHFKRTGIIPVSQLLDEIKAVLEQYRPQQRIVNNSYTTPVAIRPKTVLTPKEKPVQQQKVEAEVVENQAIPAIDPFENLEEVQSPPVFKGFGVQVGVFSQFLNAEQFQKTLASQYDQEIKIFTVRSKGRLLHRVLFVPFSSREQAMKFQTVYEWEQGRDTIIKDLDEL